MTASSPPLPLRAMTSEGLLTRRSFLEAVAGVGVVAGAPILGCNMGSRRGDPKEYDPCLGATGPREQRVELAGYPCDCFSPLRLICPTVVPEIPVVVALHAIGEDSQAVVARWRLVAEASRFHLCAVNWHPETDDPEQVAADLTAVISSFVATFDLSPARVHLVGYRQATPVVWKAAFEIDSVWHGAAFIGGAPPGDWVGDPTAATAEMIFGDRTRLHYSVGDADPEYAGALACRDALLAKSKPVRLNIVPGALDITTVDLEALYAYIDTVA